MEPSQDQIWREHRAAFHEEINRLPRDDRTAIVLCDLQGQARGEAAHQLRWSLGKLDRRLARARARLQARMSGRGLTIPVTDLATTCSLGLGSDVPGRLIEETIDIATRGRPRGADGSIGQHDGTAVADVHGLRSREGPMRIEARSDSSGDGAGPDPDGSSKADAAQRDPTTRGAAMSANEPGRDEPRTIRDLLDRIKEGDEDAARELLHRYEAKVRLVVSRQLPRLLRSRFDSLDFLQSVWGSFFQKIRTGPNDLHEEKNLVAFLAWAARNKVIDECRRAGTQRYDVHRETSLRVEGLGGKPVARPGETPSQVAQARETYGRLRDLLPENRRIILEMKAEGFTCREIGDQLGLSERTVQRVLDDLRRRADREQRP